MRAWPAFELAGRWLPVMLPVEPGEAGSAVAAAVRDLPGWDGAVDELVAVAESVGRSAADTDVAALLGFDVVGGALVGGVAVLSLAPAPEGLDGDVEALRELVTEAFEAAGHAGLAEVGVRHTGAGVACVRTRSLTTSATAPGQASMLEMCRWYYVLPDMDALWLLTWTTPDLAVADELVAGLDELAASVTFEPGE